MMDLLTCCWHSDDNYLIGKNIVKNDEVREFKRILKNCFGIFLQGHQKESVLDLAVSWNGMWVASGCADWTVRVWKLETCEQVAEFSEFVTRVWSVCFVGTDEVLLAGAEDGKVFVLQVWKGRVFGVLKYGKGAVVLMREIRGSFGVACLYRDGVVIIWNYHELVITAKFDQKMYISLSTNFENNTIILIDSNLEIDFIDSNTQKLIKSLNLKQQTQLNSNYDSIHPIKNSPNFILTFKDQDPKSFLLDPNQSKIKSQFSLQSTSIISSTSSSTSELIYISSKPKGIQILNPSQNLIQNFIQNKNIYTTLNIDNNHEFLILGTSKGSIELRDLHSGALLQKTAKMHSYITTLFMPRSKAFLLTVDNSNNLKLWDLKTRKPIYQSKSSLKITCTSFSESSHLIAYSTLPGSLFITSPSPSFLSIEIDKISPSSILFTVSSLLIIKTSSTIPSIHTYKVPKPLKLLHN